MANLFSIDSGRLIAFIGKLHQHGVTAEEVEECLRDGDAAKRRILAFKNPSAPVPEPLWRPVEGCSNVIEVNLAHPGTLPFTGAETGWQWGQMTGWVRTEIKDDNLYVKGKKVVFHLEPEQTKGSIVGNLLHDRLKAGNSASHLHPNILEACREAGILPESWKADNQGRTRYTFAWAKGYRRSGGSLCVRYLYWDGGQWNWHYGWLDYGFGVQYPAAVSDE